MMLFSLFRKFEFWKFLALIHWEMKTKLTDVRNCVTFHGDTDDVTYLANVM